MKRQLKEPNLNGLLMDLKKRFQINQTNELAYHPILRSTMNCHSKISMSLLALNDLLLIWYFFVFFFFSREIFKSNQVRGNNLPALKVCTFEEFETLKTVTIPSILPLATNSPFELYYSYLKQTNHHNSFFLLKYQWSYNSSYLKQHIILQMII